MRRGETKEADIHINPESGSNGCCQNSDAFRRRSVEITTVDVVRTRDTTKKRQKGGLAREFLFSPEVTCPINATVQ